MLCRCWGESRKIRGTCKTRIIITIIIGILEVVAREEVGRAHSSERNNLQKPGVEKKKKRQQGTPPDQTPTLYKRKKKPTKAANLPLQPLSLTDPTFPFPPLRCPICIPHHTIIAISIVFLSINTMFFLPCNGFHSIVPFPIPDT